MSVVESVGSEDTEGSGGTEGSEGTEIHEDPAAVIASVARMAKPFPVTYLQSMDRESQQKSVYSEKKMLRGLPSLQQMALMQVASNCIADVGVVRSSLVSLLLSLLFTPAQKLTPQLAQYQRAWIPYTRELQTDMRVERRVLESPFLQCMVGGGLDSLLCTAYGPGRTLDRLFSDVHEDVDEALEQWVGSRTEEHPVGVCWVFLNAVLCYIKRRIDWPTLACAITTEYTRHLPVEMQDALTHHVFLYADALVCRHANLYESGIPDILAAVPVGDDREEHYARRDKFMEKVLGGVAASAIAQHHGAFDVSMHAGALLDNVLCTHENTHEPTDTIRTLLEHSRVDSAVTQTAIWRDVYDIVSSARGHQRLYPRHHGDFHGVFNTLEKCYCVVVDELACTIHHWTSGWAGKSMLEKRRRLRERIASVMSLPSLVLTGRVVGLKLPVTAPKSAPVTVPATMPAAVPVGDGVEAAKETGPTCQSGPSGQQPVGAKRKRTDVVARKRRAVALAAPAAPTSVGITQFVPILEVFHGNVSYLRGDWPTYQLRRAKDPRKRQDNCFKLSWYEYGDATYLHYNVIDTLTRRMRFKCGMARLCELENGGCCLFKVKTDDLRVTSALEAKLLLEALICMKALVPMYRNVAS